MKNIFLFMIFTLTIMSCSKDTEYVYIEKPKIKEKTSNKVIAFFDKDGNIKELGNSSKEVTTYNKDGKKVSSKIYESHISKLRFFEEGIIVEELKDEERRNITIEHDKKGREISVISETLPTYKKSSIIDPNGYKYNINIPTYNNSDTIFTYMGGTDWMLCVDEVEVSYTTNLYDKILTTYNDSEKTASVSTFRSTDGKEYIKYPNTTIFKLDDDGNIDYSEGHIITRASESLSRKKVVKKDGKENIIMSYSYYIYNGKKHINTYNTYSYKYF